jgi:Flp pilus assembly protein TadG
LTAYAASGCSRTPGRSGAITGDGMGSRLRRLGHNQDGVALVFVGMGLMALTAVSILAADVGMLLTARAQAQNAADAGALSGAVSLVFDDYEDRSPAGPAVQAALAAARANPVMGEAVSVTAEDVQFPTNPQGQASLVEVTVYRTAGRSNPLATLVGQFFGLPIADVVATATAEAAPSNAETCVKPFTIPDKWIERQTPPWDPADTFDLFDHKGKPLADPDIYLPADHANYTGYNPDADKGMQLVLKAGTGNNVAPSFYYALRLPGSSGAADYRWNIGNCNMSILYFGDLLDPEPGNMVGPTKQGIEDLIARDPTAYWDAVSNRVVSNMHPSPRVAVVPLFDPEYYQTGKQTGANADLKAANFLGFFIEGLQGNDVVGRITPIGGLRDGSGPAPAGAFPRTTRLVK